MPTAKKQIKRQHATRAVAIFNRLYRKGTKVYFIDSLNKQQVATETKSEAFVDDLCSPVVRLKGLIGLAPLGSITII